MWESVFDTEDAAEFQGLLKNMDALRKIKVSRRITPQG
jgi:hypothetical protein